jgi:hypothetical protein
VFVRTAPSPTGPWSTPFAVWTCPEPAADPRHIVYAPKLHPELSSPDALLLSYCVNSTEFADVLTHAAVYCPRFVWVPREVVARTR